MRIALGRSDRAPHGSSTPPSVARQATLPLAVVIDALAGALHEQCARVGRAALVVATLGAGKLGDAGEAAGAAAVLAELGPQAAELARLQARVVEETERLYGAAGQA